MHQEFWTSCWIAQHCGLAGSEKWALTCSFAILDYIEWLGSRCEAFKPNCKCRNKEKPNQRYLKVSYRFISFWQRHSHDFRQQPVVTSLSFACLILGLMSYLFCFNVDTLCMGYSHRNCVVIGCPNSRQRLGKWAATTCELHGCNNGSSICDSQPLFKLFPFPTEKKNPERRLQ